MAEITFIDGAFVVNGDSVIIPPYGVGLAYGYLTAKPKINGVELIGNKTSADLHIEGGGGGGSSYSIGSDLVVRNNILSVDKATAVSGTDTRPVSSQAVHLKIGDVENILQTI